MKVLIVGLGSIGRKHVDAIKTIDNSIEIYALRSSNASASYSSVINLYNMEEVSSYQFDFVIISNPTSEHQNSIEKFSDLNCPIFIEKPLFHLLSIADTVKRIDNHIITYIACNLRFLDCIKFLKDFVTQHSSKINEVNVYCGSYLPEWRNNTDYKTNYSAFPELGGGVHLDLIHEIDYLYWFFGNPLNTHKFCSNKSSLNIQSVDYAHYCMEYDTFNASILLNYYRRDPKRTCEIVCDDKTITADLLHNRISDSNGNIIFESPQTIMDTYKEQMEYFINKVKTHTNTFNTIMDAYNVLQICLK